VLQAGILPESQLAYAVDNPHGNADPTLVSARSPRAKLGRHPRCSASRSASVGERGGQSVDLSVAWQEWQAAQDARLRAFRILSLEQRLPLAREVERDLADGLALTRKRSALGYQTEPELTAAAGAWTQAETAALIWKRSWPATGPRWRLALACRPGPHWPSSPPPPSGTAGGNRIGRPPICSRVWRTAASTLVALRRGYESQDASLRAAIKAQFPKINLSVNRARDTDAGQHPGLGYHRGPADFRPQSGQVAIGQATRQATLRRIRGPGRRGALAGRRDSRFPGRRQAQLRNASEDCRRCGSWRNRSTRP